MFGSFIFIYAYKYALKSIFHRLSIEFASNLHRLCNGGSLEEHWRIIGGTLENLALQTYCENELITKSGIRNHVAGFS